MRILFVAPYPPSRIRVRSYGFLQQLRRDHDVVVLALCSSQRELIDAEALRSQGFEVVVVREYVGASLAIAQILRSGLALVSSRSLHAAYASSARFAQAFQRLCTQRQFDVVHVEHLRGIAAIEPLAYDLPLVWDAVDCLSLLYKHTMVAGPNLAMRAAARLEHKRIQQFEARMVSKLQHVLVTSERDRQALTELRSMQTEEEGACCHAERRAPVVDTSAMGRINRLLWMMDRGPSRGQAQGTTPTGITSTINVLPNGVDLDYFRPMQEKRRFNLVFSGTMSYHPNVATAIYLYRQIMPIIWQQRPEVTLTLVGSSPPSAIRRLANHPRVEVTGYVDDIRPYVGRAEVMLCPMVYSVGIQNKVLEAMAMGTPVVVAPQSAEVFGVSPGRELLVAETPQQFAEAALRLLDDAELHGTLSRFGRAYVERHHNWQAMTDRLVNIYAEAVATYKRKDPTRLA